MRVLIIEDDADVAKILERRLFRAGFNVNCTYLGEEGVELVRHYPFDLVLLDLNMSDISGQAVLRRLKLVSARLPVLIFSADDTVETRLRCFALGADDYVTKPCNGDELVARIRALIRRTYGHLTPTLRIGKLSVDTVAREVSADGRPVPLTPREYQLFEMLAQRPGRTVSTAALLTEMYDGENEPTENVIRVFICKIRQKIATVAPSLPARIKTIRGRGYTLTP